MTKEEAIDRLKHTDACDSDLCEAIDIAIKSLEKDIKQYAVYIKNYCKYQGTCTDCSFYNPDDITCKLSNTTSDVLPEDWEV